MLECTLGAYSARTLYDCEPPAGVCWDVAADELLDDSDWTDGSLAIYEASDFAPAGSGVYARSRADAWRSRGWVHFDGLTADGSAASCRGFGSLLGRLQTVQRAEFWRIILALQASRAVHLVVDNLNVVRHVGRLLGGTHAFRPLELQK